MNIEKRRIDKYINKVTGWRFKLFLFFKLPLAFIAGLKIKHISQKEAFVTVPFSFWNKNPFNSIYFAVLSMAGELSSGILALMHIYKTEKRISMLVVKIESHFYKKATDKIKFICKDGDKISSAIKDTLKTGEGKVVITNSKGYNKEGICVAEFNVHWSFKAKNK